MTAIFSPIVGQGRLRRLGAYRTAGSRLARPCPFIRGVAIMDRIPVENCRIENV